MMTSLFLAETYVPEQRKLRHCGAAMRHGSKQNTETKKKLTAHSENPKTCANYRNTPPEVAKM